MKERWALSAYSYTKKAIEEVEREVTAANIRLPTKVTTPLSSGYRPELDNTLELDPNRQNYYQGLIGIFIWICELGRIEIVTPVSMLSRYLVMAREGHLGQEFHIFAYLKGFMRYTMVFDDTESVVDESRFLNCDWDEFYPDAVESLPKEMPEPRGKPLLMSFFVDADHFWVKIHASVTLGSVNIS